MKNVLVLTRKELGSYFQSPIAYIVTAIFLLLSGIIFAIRFSMFHAQSLELARNPYMMQHYGLDFTEHVLQPTLFTLNFFSLLMLPMVTMRALSEDKKTGTIELLLTYPVRDMEVALSKLFACMGVYLCMLAPTLLYPILSMKYAEVEVASLGIGYLGLLLSGAAFVSIGIFISSLTENQIIAVAASYGSLFLFWFFGAAETLASDPYNVILTQLSLFKHMEDFAAGVLNSHDVFYFLAFAVFFMFLTLRSLEITRWKGKA
jgi:ABC-2 type transport system permease protein